MLDDIIVFWKHVTETLLTFSSNLSPVYRLLVLLSAHFLYSPLLLPHEVQNKAKSMTVQRHLSTKTPGRNIKLVNPSERKTKLLMAKKQIASDWRNKM